MKFNHQVTLKDIAKRLGMSTSTVSRALQDHPDISSKTKEKVNKLAAELDYQPNVLAMNLRKSKSDTIGVIVPEIVNHFFSTVLSGIESVAHEKGYRVIICQSNENYEREKDNIQGLIASRVDGLLISVASETKDFEHLTKLQNKGFPFVFYDRVCKDFNVSTVEVDDFEGSFKVVEHLIQSGSTRIAHIAGPENTSISSERMRGYVAALQKYNLPQDESLIIREEMTIWGGVKAAERILTLSPIPDAVFGVNDKVTIGAFRKFKEKGIKIPEQIAIAGFNNDPLTANVEPPITVLAQPGFEIGETAARMLIEQIEVAEGETIPIRNEKLKGELIIRKSSMKTNIQLDNDEEEDNE